jgi:hypothetical protein
LFDATNCAQVDKALLAGNRNNTLLEAANFDAARMIVE